MAKRTFKVEKGISIDNIDIVWGGIDPSNVGYIANKGSLYIQSNDISDSLLYQKFGDDEKDWRIFSTSENISLVSEIKHKVNIDFIKENMVYTGNKLTSIEYKNENNDNVYIKSFAYTNNKLTSWIITRVVDNVQLVCNMVYSNGKLIKKEYL